MIVSIRDARVKTFVTIVHWSEDAIGRVFDVNVRRSVGCKTFFPKAV